MYIVVCIKLTFNVAESVIMYAQSPIAKVRRKSEKICILLFGQGMSIAKRCLEHSQRVRLILNRFNVALIVMQGRV